MMQPILDTDRDIRLSKAVALVTNRKYSVRKAAHALQLPKSTVHRYLQATRGHLGVSKRPRSRRATRPAKCDISFLVESDADRSEHWWRQPAPTPHARQQHASAPHAAPPIFAAPFPVRPRSCAPEMPPFHPPGPAAEDVAVRKLPSIST